MDIKREILKSHSRKQARKVANYALGSSARFKNLLDIYLAGPYRITQRASWPLGICAEEKPALIKPYLKKLLDFLATPGIHDAVKRNTIRLLQFIDVPKRNRDQVITICFEYLQNPKEALAVRVFSMSVLHKLLIDIPELQRELAIMIEDQLPYAMPAFKSRAMKVLKALQDKGLGA